MERNLTVVSYSHILITETEFLQELSFFLYFLASVGFPDPRNGMCASPFGIFDLAMSLLALDV